MNLNRRQMLASLGAAGLLALWPVAAGAAGTTSSAASDTRLLVVLLRGGLDGLHVLPPYADPDYQRLRGGLVANQADPHRLDGLFALHPALNFMGDLYARRELLPIVAVAPPYRERSHFEAQDCVENGSATPGGARDGWMNRCVAALPGSEGLAVASVMPLILRGASRVETWSPPLANDVDPVLLQRLQTLYAADPALARNFEQTLRQADGESIAGDGKRNGRFPQLMTAAARLMSANNGPRIGFVEDNGWDTHGNQVGILDRKLAELDDGLRAFHDGAGGLWPRTVVAVLTEFGRTAAVNGTGGTDHGTGAAMFLAGGAVNGGRIGGDWPGLRASNLNEGRDLRATTDLRAVFRQVLSQHLAIDGKRLDQHVFPGSAGLPDPIGASSIRSSIVHAG